MLFCPTRLFRCALLTCLGVTVSLAAQQQTIGNGWPAYGGDAGGSRYSAATQITPANVTHLHPVWSFHTHALDKDRPGMIDASFETTPVLLGHTLYLTSPFDEVFALDATTGRELWHHDPQIYDIRGGMIVTSRGVALWPATAIAPEPQKTCATRVFLGTLDGRLLALDAATGDSCSDFGKNGEVDLHPGIHFANIGGYGLTSAPTVIGDVVVVGSSVADNQQVEVESGTVRGFDARTGALLWSWNPLPWAEAQHPRTGAGNAWSTISADPKLGLVYVPTGSASPDFYGGLRLGDNRDADSVVALDARTGKKVWALQTVHHNLWDYDVAAQPLLFIFRNSVPAVAIATKAGQVFVLDRRDGTPLYPVQEKTVPQSTVPGEATSPTQPFSALPPLAPLSPPKNNETAWHRSDTETKFCNAQLKGLHYEGIFTPPGTSPTLLYPGSLGGVNWGSLALNPQTGILYANNNREPFAITLIPRNGLSVRWHHDIEPVVRDWPLWITLSGVVLVGFCIRRRKFTPGYLGLGLALATAALASLCLIPWPENDEHFGTETSPQSGTPYLLHRELVVDHDGNPCTAPPWGAITALDLNQGRIVWQSSLGTTGAGQPTGDLTLGGPIVTASGVVFTAATKDARLHAYDATSGSLLWTATLPAPAQATPMTYEIDGKQYVVIAAGGHAGLHEHRDDSVLAFALDQ